MNQLSQYFVVLLIATLTLYLISCDNNANLEAAPLEGLIAGEPWTYRYAKSIYNPIDNIFDAELYGSQQTETDPCSIFISGEAHLSIQVPNAMGNYQIPSDIQVVFEQPGTSNDFFRATSGFVEVTAASGGQVLGYVQAVFDQDNTVEGTFSFNRCN